MLLGGWLMPDGAIAPRTLRALAIGINWFDSGSGGLDRVFHDLAATLPMAGVEVNGLVLGPDDAEARSGGTVRAFGGGPLPLRLWHARRAVDSALRGGTIDVVAAHFALFALPALDLLRQRPLIVHFHGPWADESAAEGAGALAVAAKRAAEGQVYRRAVRIITLSRAFADLIIRRYGVPADRVHIVPGSVDLTRFAALPSRNVARDALGWPTDRRILLTVRRLARRMGLDRLIAAMPAIVDAEPDVLLMIAGRGELQDKLRAQVETFGLDAHVRFIGFVPEAELPLAYRAAELNLVPTRALEGFGLTAAEALAAGTPSIVAPVGGLPEVVGPLAEDLVFPGETPGAIAAHIIEALRGRLALPTSVACRNHARLHFAPYMAALRTAAIYRAAA